MRVKAWVLQQNIRQKLEVKFYGRHDTNISYRFSFKYNIRVYSLFNILYSIYNIHVEGLNGLKSKSGR